MSGPRGIPFDPGKPGGIPLEGGHIEAPRCKPPLGSAGPFPCGEWACIVKEWGGISPLAMALSHKSKGLPHTIVLVRHWIWHSKTPYGWKVIKSQSTHKHLNQYQLTWTLCTTWQWEWQSNNREPVRELPQQVRRIYFGGPPVQNWEMAIPWDGWGVAGNFCSCASVCTRSKYFHNTCNETANPNQKKDMGPTQHDSR